MNTSQSPLIVEPSAFTIFTLDKSTIDRVLEFRKSHPEIGADFINKEINAAINEVVYRMEREADAQE